MKRYYITEEQLENIKENQNLSLGLPESIEVNTDQGKREIEIVNAFLEDINLALKKWVEEVGKDKGMKSLEILIKNFGKVGEYQILVLSNLRETK